MVIAPAQRILASLKFIFRVERDPQNVKPGDDHAISDFELASRLAFFLWSSILDDQLLQVAGQAAARRASSKREVRACWPIPRPSGCPPTSPASGCSAI